MGATKPVSENSFDKVIADPKVRRLFVIAAATAGKHLQTAGRLAAVELLSRFSAYEDYLLQTYRRVSTIKTFAAPTMPVPLMNHFVDTYLHDKRESQIDQVDLLKSISSGSRTVISASAGFGKSVLMRYLALSLYETPRGKIPIFIELRDLNRVQSPDLIAYIHANYKQNSNIDSAVLVRGLELGVFAIFLDGFDEINFDRRSVIEDNILQLSADYPDISIFVSGRPDETFDSWQAFSTFIIRPMELEQVKSLIQKIDYDSGLKNKFLQKLDDGLYENHSSFLSTPLLATLMMMTYENNAAIPDKMHLFYQRSFETLFDKHDTYKEQYERKRRSGLRIDEFSRLFSVFCIHTYLEETFEFSKVGILEAIDNAIAYCGYEVGADDVLFDLTESVCLIQLEGFFYSFVHRSFQEYFSALFLCTCPEEIRDEFLGDFTFRPWDSVLPMLFDMTTDRLEASWISPRSKEYIAFVESKGISEVGFQATIARWHGIELRLNERGDCAFQRIRQGPFANTINILSRFYEKTLGLSISYLTVEMVDICGKAAAEKIGLNYIAYRDYMNNMHEFSKNPSTVCSFIDNRDVLLNSGIIEEELSIYKSIKIISSSISDNSLIRQRFLGRIRKTSK